MIEMIPAIDLIAGKCVRLAQGDFSRATVYSSDPVETVQSFESAGVKRLHIVDLDGAKTGKIANLAVLEQIAANTDLVIDFGGGIKTDDDIRSVFDSGAAMANMGSIAVRDPTLFRSWLNRYGSEKVLLGADAKEGTIAVDGWQTATSIDVIEFLRGWFADGLRQAFVTDIARDGLMTGPSIELYKQIIAALPDLRLIASGGVNSVGDISELEA
ncbi:MAG: HisA/HisF-related TIM barrel protein, partial [Candidatus Binatia bacterium]